MTSEGNILPRFLELQKVLVSSLRLKDSLDAAIHMFTEMAGGAKVALFLADNESMTFKLMAAKGYSDGSMDQMRIIPFGIESLLKYVQQKRIPITAKDPSSAPELSAAIMRRETSKGQIGLPMIAGNSLVGAVLLEVNNPQILGFADFLKEVADVCAVAISNSVVYGRSEYERERITTLYQCICALNNSSLDLAQVLQVAADTSLVMANTPSCAVLLLDDDNLNFQLAAFKGLDGASLSDFDMSERNSIAGKCLRSATIEVYGDGSKEPFGLPRAMGGRHFASAVALPLVFLDRKLGVLEVFSTDSRAFHKEQLDLLESLARQVSASLNTALSHETSRFHSFLDAHTGLANRRHFEQGVVKELDRSKRHNHELSVLLIDIDHLSQINDMLGQNRGDEAIKHVAAVVKSTLRDIDLPARYGGEEFAVLLPETSHANALEVAERLRQAIRKSPAPGIGLITVSIGLAGYPSNAEDPGALLRDAEEALNVAKYEGRDRVKAAQTGKIAPEGSISWSELANQAKMAVISERQGRLQSKLTAAPEYATWLAKPGSLVAKKKSS
jgi:diguanylate cyclase (GGDEF)-like protein